MFKVYNTQKDFTSNISNFIKKVFPNIRKTHLKVIPFIVFGMISSESCVSFDIAYKLKGPFLNVHVESIVKRIYRFFNNPLFSPYFFYDKVIRFVINNYKIKHKDNKVHIIFDHMFMRNSFTVLMFSMRVGRQSIPLWFRCFKGEKNPDAFTEDIIKKGISYCYELFSKKNYKLIFLADRWFNSSYVMEHINSLGCIYNIRLKENIKCFVYDKKEGHKVWKFISDLKHYKYHSVYYNNIGYTNRNIKVNIAISSCVNTSTPWIIITNGPSNRAIRDYSYRFGGIECLFKIDKSNGFQLEDSAVKNIKAFTTMYTLISFSILFLTIIGTDYCKNTKSYRNIKIPYRKGNNRSISLFRIGIILFNRAFNSPYYVRLPFTFILYDI